MTKEYRTLTCTNKKGYSIVFDETSISPFLLIDADGLYNAEYSVTTVTNGNVDGSTFVGRQLKERNIVLTVLDIDMFAKNRELLDKVFSCGGTLVYDDGIHKRKIDYIVEKVSGTDGTFKKRTHQISLICPNPYFTDLEDNNIAMSYIDSLFEFPHDFVDEEISKIVKTQNIEILNENGAETGMTILLEANGKVVNPSLSLEETGETLMLGINGSMDFILEANQKVEITTQVRNCFVRLIKSDGSKENINQYLTSDSSFLRLQTGVNHLSYAAKSGADNLNVTISYKNNYLEV
jgi:hypothetical protein